MSIIIVINYVHLEGIALAENAEVANSLVGVSAKVDRHGGAAWGSLWERRQTPALQGEPWAKVLG